MRLQDFFKRIKRLPEGELRTLVGLCAAVALLVVGALTLAGALPLPEAVRVAVQESIGSQSAAVWQSYFPQSGCGGACSDYAGMPSPRQFKHVHYPPGSGACYSLGYTHCTSTPDQCVVTTLGGSSGRVGALSASATPGGSVAGAVRVNGATQSAGSGVVITSGQTVNFEWACQDLQIAPTAVAHSGNYCNAEATFSTYYADNLTLSGPDGTLYSGSTLVGSVSPVITGTAGPVQKYTLACKRTSTGQQLLTGRGP